MLQSTVTNVAKRNATRQARVLSFPAHNAANPDANNRSHDRKVQVKNGAAARSRDLTAILRQINQTVDFRQRFDLASFVNWKGNAAAPIHRWLRYREAYSPHLITKLGLSDNILDPFCGCGSILIGSAERGLTSAGIDINPLAVFATKVKLNPLSRVQLAAIRTFVDGIGARMKSKTLWPLPALSIASKVFEPDILETLLRIRAMVESDFSRDKSARDFLHLAWVAILEAVGSYFKEGNGIKYRNKKRLKTGYIRRLEGEWQYERFGRDQKQFVLDVFCSQIRLMLNDAKFWRKGRWKDQTVIQGNVLEMDRLFTEQKFKSIMFSPPYANRFDYFESMKVELWFGGFVDSYESAGRFRKASLRSHLGADLNRSYSRVNALERLIELMDTDASSWRMGVPELLRGYFDDMRVTLKHCNALLDKGKCYIVVGNSAFAGVIIPTDVLLANLALESGFKNAEILVARHLTVAPQQRNHLAHLQDNMRESVVVLS